jgi:hypothetical protein
MRVQLPPGFGPAFLNRFQTVLPTAGPQALGILAYAGQGLGWVPSLEWRRQYMSAVQGVLPRCSSHNLGSIGCWVAGWGRVPEAEWRDAWLAACHRQLPKTTPQVSADCWDLVDLAVEHASQQTEGWRHHDLQSG